MVVDRQYFLYIGQMLGKGLSHLESYSIVSRSRDPYISIKMISIPGLELIQAQRVLPLVHSRSTCMIQVSQK